MDIPANKAELTTAFMSEVLNTEVLAVSDTQIAEGTGFIGELHRLRLNYAVDGAGPDSVIVKLPTQDPTSRFVGGLMRLYEKESGFYRELAHLSPVRVPHCYYNGADLENDQWCLVIEDIVDATTGDQLLEPSPDLSREMVRQLARIHAAYESSVHDVAWLEGLGSQGIAAMMPMYLDVRDDVMQRYSSVAPEGMFELCNRFYNVLPEYFAEMDSMSATLLHGDFRMDNMMLRDDGSFVVLDWQVVTRAPGGYDLYYLMALTFGTESRRSMHDELIELYLDTLKSEGATVPSHDDLLRVMRGAGLFLGVLGTIQMSQLNPANPRGEELFLTMWRRGVQMFHDIDCGAYL